MTSVLALDLSSLRRDARRVDGERAHENQVRPNIAHAHDGKNVLATSIQ